MSGKYPGGFVTLGAPAGYSVAFDGTGDYLSAPSNAAFGFGTGDFTVEGWYYFTGTIGTYQRPWWFGDDNDNAEINGSVIRVGGASQGTLITGTTTLIVNRWYHVALTRASGVYRLWLNGTQEGSSATNSYNSSARTLGIAATTGGANPITGNVSNFRILKGTALYTATFTPPTQLFPIANTSLLTCQSPNIIDNSSNAFAITANGNAAPSTFTPFVGYTAGASGFRPALGAAAPGVWTLDEATTYQNNRQWPIYDPNFNQTTLLLHGNQPAGVTDTNNNVFKDSSTTNATITRVGNTTQNTFSPFSQTGWSTYFTGTSYVTLPANTNYDIMGGDFTIEFWWNWQKGNTMSFSGIQIATTFVSSVGWYISAESGSADSITGITFGTFTTGYNSVSNTALNSSNMRRGTWNHIAIVRSGSGSGNLKFYLNGVNVGGAFNAPPAYSGAGNQLAFGVYLQNLTYAGNPDMYISNFRIVKGSALYTSNFTPSTAPLTAVPGTVLLTHQDNKFVDNSAINAQYSYGTAGTTIQPYSPLIPSITTPTTYSNWFNGSTGYLSVPNNAAFQLGNGNFTIEAWVNVGTLPASGSIQAIASKWDGASQNSWYFYLYNNSGTYQLYFSYSTTGSTFVNPVANLTGFSSGTFYHVAAVRSGVNLYLFLNGNQVGSTYNISTDTIFAGTYTPQIGAAAGASFFNGAISNVRIVKGTALYTSAFTVPTAPLTNISGTSLLTCQSSTLIDNSTANSGAGFTLTPTGAVSPVTSPVPFAPLVDQTTLNTAYSTTLMGGSAYFDGSDYLTFPSDAALAFGTGDYTVEAWVYFTSVTGAALQVIFRSGAGGNNFYFSVDDNQISVGTGTVFISIQGTTFVANTWYHVAACRTAGTLRLFSNGVQVGSSVTDSTNFVSTGTAGVGSNEIATQTFSGYMSNVRVNKSSLYTTNFAPPPQPLTPIANTGLLLNYTNAGIIDNTAKNVLETLGSAQISTVQSKWGGRSISFNGTNSYLQIPSSPTFAMGGGNWTVEMWMYPNTVSGLKGLLSFGAGAWRFFQNGAGFWFLNGGSGVLISSSNLTAGRWYHVALVKAGTGTNQTSLYLDGVLIASGTDANTYAPGTAFVGSEGAGSYFDGYLDDLRITKAARYLGNFTPPTSQLQDQ
jgi:hypothetical protein